MLIEVAAAGINRPDAMQRRGLYPPPQGVSDIPGLEVAGTIVDVGPEAGDWTPGDRVCALVSGGGYAEYCVAPAVQCLPVPRGLDLVRRPPSLKRSSRSGRNVFERGRLKPGEWILIHGGSSGIGTTAIQLAHVLRRARAGDSRVGGEVPGLRAARRRARASTTGRSISSPPSRERHRRTRRGRRAGHGRRRLPARATSAASRSRVGWSRSRCREDSTVELDMRPLLTTTAHDHRRRRCAPRSAAEKGAIADGRT